MSQPWNLPEREVTPELAAFSRRKLLAGLGIAGGVALAGGAGLWWWNRGTDQEVLASGKPQEEDDLWAKYYPVKQNAKFAGVDTPLTREADAARYCNFFEFTDGKNVWKFVEPFKPHPWTLEVKGLVAKPKTFAFEDLLKGFALEERIYRHRCVETWAMVVPWTGFVLADLLKKVEPLPSAKFVKFVTVDRPVDNDQARKRHFPWPYVEGLTLAEATHELAFMATGMYGHSLLKQHGAPIRLVVPWKYGFKSAKSVVRIELVAEQPATFWNTLAAHEYGFVANVDPSEPHPRWSQASETMLDTRAVRKTQLYNGYGDWVGGLYKS